MLDGGGAPVVVLGDGVSVDASRGARGHGEGEHRRDAGRRSLADAGADPVVFPEARHAQDAHPRWVMDQEADRPVEAPGQEEQKDGLDDKAGDEGGRVEHERREKHAPIDGCRQGNRREDGIDGQQAEAAGRGGLPPRLRRPEAAAGDGQRALDAARLPVPKGLQVGEKGISLGNVSAGMRICVGFFIHLLVYAFVSASVGFGRGVA